ncbi:MAG TPA: transcription-repair coupling factor [Candidatus Hydrogenedentes bacterium]|nr:transcription-repair coupling factor [Candidatus Hydrogenedentota bacterium]HPC17449.1 transcription-repair coupling factor [Candidatus Hydrogenedentota bacterium]HRT20041.1 transcription-repair coupling factor [Candidatus Hydrogenedentota bacterium]HRT64895.1 transcription-repair coupling factor [Candidatus Hydrogenedentota bacterium]
MSVGLPPLAVTQAVCSAFAEGARVTEVVGPWGSAKTIVALQTARALDRSLLIVSRGRAEAEGVFEDLCTFAGESSSALFPAWEVLPSDVMPPADDIMAERMNTLERMAAASKAGKPLHVALPLDALLQYVPRADRLFEPSLRLRVGEEHDLEELIGKLVRLGYRRELMVEQRGEISVRGGILDLFPISSELPYRVEFFGDTIESIRRFEPETQRSVESVQEAFILPRSEKDLLEAHADGSGAIVPITAYLPDNALIVLDEPLALAEEANAIRRQVAGNRFFMSWDDALKHLDSFARLSLAQLAHDRVSSSRRITATMHAVSGWTGNMAGFWRQLTEWDKAGYRVVLIGHTPGERKRLLELLEGQGYRPGHDRFDLRVELGRLHAGFASTSDRLAVLSEREIFGRHYVRRVRRRFEAGESITAFSDLRTGDYVVHEIHGIGRYEGLRRFEGKTGDFLAVRYTGGDMLYVPATRVDLVQKYIGDENIAPKLDRIGGATWARTKKRIRKAVHDMTAELVKLYAARASEEGFAFSEDTPWQREFEDSFEYDETPDQARAIAEVKADMQSPKIMDRLVCGDVGFGKTEVAIRAAFKAVMDSRQVAVLVPTTVLAQQHFTTFTERMADYPIRIEMLSRFQTAKKQKATIERLKSGEVDIVIGTHRLASKDVAFKNLGLLIIDEEQRFGVAQKEKLKQLRRHVDVLTLTATPIPRTLHLSLSGIRDMSLINTAPNDRLPIHTCIETYDESLIQEAILREMRREGQVFFLHNRVQTILSVAERIRKLVPAARVAVAHGQMHEHRLEEVMSAFIRREIDVLVCTTIIGSGLDIPNANTIIVDRADRFGLAELYQLRGRVGRYKHRAFAYLLIPGDRIPTEDAQKRLKALEEFSTLGSGFRIAMRDLEIRGCGNILGGQQHGHIVSVGYETYAQLLREAVAEIKGEPLAHRVMPPFDVAVEAYIPEAYVPSEAQKITLYKRIAGIATVEDAREMVHELTDRFGKPPAPVRRLIDIMRVRALGADAAVKTITATRDSIRIEFESPRIVHKAKALLTEQFGRRVTFSGGGRPAICFELAQHDDPIRCAGELLAFLAEF